MLLDRRSNQHLPWLMVYAYRTSGKHRDFSYHTLMNYLTSSPGASMKIDRHFFERGSLDLATLDARKIKFHYRLIGVGLMMERKRFLPPIQIL